MAIVAEYKGITKALLTIGEWEGNIIDCGEEGESIKPRSVQALNIKKIRVHCPKCLIP